MGYSLVVHEPRPAPGRTDTTVTIMPGEPNYLDLDDAALRAQCDVDIYKSSGPGGQHRNKVSSAVRLRHRPTGVSAHGDESRSQQDNRRMALRRLRMKIACTCRRPVDPAAETPPVVAECIFTRRGSGQAGGKRMEIGRKDGRFWTVAAYLLDLLDARDGRLSDAAAVLGISTGNIVSLLKSDRHLLTAVQQVRKAHGQKPIT